MFITDLEQRRYRILEAIVEAYVSSASPVGSELIAKRMRSALSPATIRNIMVDLEESGLLEQPHTSAGRVPTDRGYRFYVDRVMDVPSLTPEQVQLLQARLAGGDADPGQFLRQVSGILAQLTQEAAFVLAPTVKRTAIQHIEVIPLDERRVLCVLVAPHDVLASHVVEIEDPVSRDEAVALGRFLNTELIGLPFEDLVASLERRLLSATDAFYHLARRSLAILEQALATEPHERLVLEGTSYVVAQPEFQRDPEKAHQFLRGLEAHDALLEQLRSDLSTGKVQVRIGGEVQLSGCDTCSYVAAPLVAGQMVVGGIGVLGPTRMDYRQVSAMVDGIARLVNTVLAEGGRG